VTGWYFVIEHPFGYGRIDKALSHLLSLLTFRRRILSPISLGCKDFLVCGKLWDGSEENQFRTNHNRTRQSRR
jgi:hypothetical protein